MRLWVLAALIPLLGAPLARAQMHSDDGVDRMRRPTVTASGQAQVSIKPDQAIVRLGVMAQAEQAADAQNQVNQAMQTILQAIRGQNVPQDMIQTQDLSIYPVYSQDPPRPGQQQMDEPRITGYRASNTVQVKLDDLGKVGPVVDAGIQAGANQLQGVDFQVKDDTAVRAEALRQAVRNARTKAEAMAAAADVSLGGVGEIVESGSQIHPPRPMFAGRAMMEMAATPVEPGQVDVTVHVTVTYFITASGQDGAAAPTTRP